MAQIDWLSWLRCSFSDAHRRGPTSGADYAQHLLSEQNLQNASPACCTSQDLKRMRSISFLLPACFCKSEPSTLFLNRRYLFAMQLLIFVTIVMLLLLQLLWSLEPEVLQHQQELPGLV